MTRSVNSLASSAGILAWRSVNPPGTARVRQVGLGAGVGDERQIAVHGFVGKDDRVRSPAVETLVDGAHLVVCR